MKRHWWPWDCFHNANLLCRWLCRWLDIWLIFSVKNSLSDLLNKEFTYRGYEIGSTRERWPNNLKYRIVWISCQFFLWYEFNTVFYHTKGAEHFWSTLSEKLPATRTVWIASIVQEAWKYVLCRFQQSVDEVWNARKTLFHSVCDTWLIFSLYYTPLALLVVREKLDSRNDLFHASTKS